ncbi:hypothetical protein [Streptomyces sp. NPDC004065]|uniref:hypothetical protein n=1 Tax=Streptomyces sp. NPDC004065 TaxID=3364689 RepID=UPI00384EAEA6
MNTTRWRLMEVLHAPGRPVHAWPGTLTRRQVLVVTATGRDSCARTTPDRSGFPRLVRPRAKQHFGFVTGDLVRAVVPAGPRAGTWTGRVSVRARGQHSVMTPKGRLDVSHRNLRLVQRGDGYGYGLRTERAVKKGVDPGADAS